eukprot:COSAG01_NODE_1683_length_9497_cov_33.408172_12_plen_136_part_00
MWVCFCQLSSASVAEARGRLTACGRIQWSKGGDTGASVGGLASTADRFDEKTFDGSGFGIVPWRSSYIVRRQLKAALRREQHAMQSNERRRQRRSKGGGGGGGGGGRGRDSELQEKAPPMLGRYGEIAASMGVAC